MHSKAINNLLIVSVLAVALFSFATVQRVYAQSSFDVSVFQSSNSSDDVCYNAVKTGSITWLGCHSSSASSTLLIRAMSGNTTVASTSFAGSSTITRIEFVPFSSSSIVYLQIANPAVVKKLTVSGSSITEIGSLTLTGCNSATAHAILPTDLYVLCLDGTIKRVNMSSMVVTATYSSLNGSANGLTCTDEGNGFRMLSSTKGIVMCDTTEMFAFTVSGSTITLTDGIASVLSSTFKIAYISGNAVWYTSPSIGNVEVIQMDTTAMTFESTPVALPSNAGAVSLLPVTNYMLVLDGTDDSVYAYSITATQPSPALANIALGHDVTSVNRIQSTDSGLFTVSLSITDTGRWLELDNVLINGSPITTSGGVGTVAECRSPYVDVNFDGICDNPAFTGGLTGGASEPLTDTGGRVLCQFKIITDCTNGLPTNTDLTTNGIGYLFWFMLWVFMVMLVTEAGTGGVRKSNLFNNTNVVVYMVTMIVSSAIANFIGWVDELIFWVLVIVAIGFAGMKLSNFIEGKIRGGGSDD